MKVICPVFICAALWLASPALSQNKGTTVPKPDPKELARLEAQAQAYMDKEYFNLAQPVYEKLDSLVPNQAKYMFPLTICYVNNENDIKGLKYVEKCLRFTSSLPPSLSYFAAKAYHYNHRFDDAIRHYERYKAVVRKSTDKNSQNIVFNLDRQIAMCKNGKILVKKPLTLEVFNISNNINSPWPDYRPVVSADEKQILFTSNRPNTTGGNKEESGVYFEDIYMSQKNDGVWSNPVQLPGNINTVGHDAAVSLSPSGQTLIIYRYGKEKMMSAASGDLYMSTWENGAWGKAVKLPESINTGAWEPSACLSKDENTLFFTSNKEGGMGGTDLYYVKKLPGGKWALPVNLGQKINTPFDEDSPYLHPDGKTLYFSSNGHNSMGGYDIFVSRYDEEKKEWGTPENVGYPINTAHDDLYFSWSEDGRRVYFSSIRAEGEGEKDLYYAVIREEFIKTIIFKGNVTDSAAGIPVECNIKVYDKKSGQMAGIFTADKVGKYLMTINEGKNYKLVFEAPGYDTMQAELNLTELHDDSIVERDWKLRKNTNQATGVKIEAKDLKGN